MSCKPIVKELETEGTGDHDLFKVIVLSHFLMSRKVWSPLPTLSLQMYIVMGLDSYIFVCLFLN